MVAQKYVKALTKSFSDEELKSLYEAFARIAVVAKDMKFILIVKSPEISVEDKVNFLVSLSGFENEKFKNFLKILIENRRVDYLKDIFKSLMSYLSYKFNTFGGVVIGDVEEDVVKELENKLSEKFNSTIKLNLQKEDFNGLKVYIDVLNYEIAVDEAKIKRDILNQILGKGV